MVATTGTSDHLAAASTVHSGNDAHSSDGLRNTLPSYTVTMPRPDSDEEATVVADHADPPGASHGRNRSNSHLTVPLTEHDGDEQLRSPLSRSFTREQAHRMDDDLELLKIERQVSRQNESRLSREKSADDSMYRAKSRRRDEHIDEFDIATNPVHEKRHIYRPVANPKGRFGRFVKRVHGSNWLVRWMLYIAPLTFILLIPLMLGALVFEKSTVGGVYLQWFMIWLEIVWLSLWLGRIIAKCLPWPIGLVSSLFTNDSKKWRDMGKELELPATIFFWWLAIEVSFLPTMKSHLRNPGEPHEWLGSMNKVLVSVFVGAVLNFIEKVIIQLIAISFHLRTYADRIEINKFQITSLTKMYVLSKQKITMEDSEFEQPSGQPGSGARTPGRLVTDAAKGTKAVFNRFGDVAGKVAGDFTGRQTMKSTHPHQVVLALLHTTTGSQVLARRMYRTYTRLDTETIIAEDLRDAFDDEDEAEAAFAMFDKDLNGDISMEELEAVCVEIGRERKSITASLKDLDSVIGKLDAVFMFIVLVITVVVLVSLISTSASGALSSAGSVLLALSWLFSASAQEFLQSVLFVFVKHPFDVGDRVTIYGNTGALGKGDDYFVKEISLLYTEFKKMEGMVVQAPNSYLNTLFILNQRRSGGQAEAIPLAIKFGTTLDQIEGLRMRLLEFVTTEKREYQGKILTELRDIVEVHSMNVNVIFFYKSNWQNEGLRLARRNKFICAMMVAMQELGIEGPRMRYPGQKQSFPVYLQGVPHVKVPGMGHSGQPDEPGGLIHDERDGGEHQDLPFVSPMAEQPASPGDGPARYNSLHRETTLGTRRGRGESLSAMGRRMDFSLGAQDAVVGDAAGDVYEDRSRARIPTEVQEVSRSRERENEIAALRETLEGKARKSMDTNRSASQDGRFVPGSLNRRSTDSGSRWRPGAVHRNRFLGRAWPRASDEYAMMERGVMANIPENANAERGSPAEHAGYIDPRSGLVSPQAQRLDCDQSDGVLQHQPSISGMSDATDFYTSSQHRPLGRSQTEAFELRTVQ